MIRPTSCVLLVATAVLSLAAGPAPAAISGTPQTVAAVAVSADPDGCHRERVMEIAQRCLEGPHSALVGNAMRQGRVFDTAEALSWCS
ncbi:MAG: hypothetical protein ACRDV1_08635 [Actinomycetes bacterium]